MKVIGQMKTEKNEAQGGGIVVQVFTSWTVITFFVWIYGSK